METFVEGELAIMQHASYYEEWNGALAVVVGGLATRSPINMHTLEHNVCLGYQVVPLVPGGFKVTCAPYQLRKLRDRDDGAVRRVGARRGEQAEHREHCERRRAERDP